MAAVNAYLNFMGNTEDAFNFYRSVFGTEFSMFQRFSDTPVGEQMPEADRSKVMHVTLPIGGGTVLMGTDALESQGHTLTVGNNYSLALAPETLEEGTKLFNGLAEGGTVSMPMQKMFWGAYFGMLTDKFGIQWMVNFYDGPQQ
jgi:PhnB protein